MKPYLTSAILLKICALITIPVFLFSQSLPSPVLFFPANNAINQPVNVTIKWHAVPDADQYKVALGTTQYAEGSIVWDTMYTDTSYLVTNLSPGTYYWRIKAKHTATPFQSSSWSGVWNFTVSNPNAPLATPVQISPANGATGQPTIVNLSWQAVSGATQYKVSIGTNSQGTGDIVYDTSYTGTTYKSPTLSSGTYYWRIQAKNNSPYQTSNWSSFRSFTVSAPTLGTPVLVSPSNNSTLQVPGTNLTWQAVSGATFYKVKIATDPLMTAIIFQDNNVINTNRIAQNLNYNTQYYWTVQAANGNSTGTVSNPKTFKTMPDNPNAVTTHPRLLITQANLATIQSWATPSNPIFVALQNALNTAISNYNTKFFPGGQPNPVWPDIGNITWSGYVTEQYAEFFAFWSLIDPNLSNRPIHAQRARNLLMYVINEAIKGPAAGLPFRDPQFMTYDRSRVYGEACPLTVDWIYNAKDANNNDILTTSDKAKIRTVFLRWSNDQVWAWNHPTPEGIMNDKQITLTNRWILNNYYSGHARNLTFMALAMDAIDDAPLDPNIHYSALGNSLRSYIFNATGAWLYQQYAQYENPEIVSTDYNVSPAGLGMGSGGMSVEGSLYGESLGWVAQEVFALKTCGWMDEAVIGKQAKLLNSSYWTEVVDGMLHEIAPVPFIPQQASYYGPIYPVANYGDLHRIWMTPFFIDITAPIGLMDMHLNNNATRLDKCRWFTRNALQGGAGLLLQRVGNVWSESLATQSIYYFLLLPPNGSNPADPRPNMETTFFDPAFNRILARTDWTSNCSWFDWHCHWTKINHQAGDGNQFEFYRKGEWLTKERSGYTNDNIGTTSEFHNTIGLQNDVPANLQWYEGPISQRGGQWKEGLNAGDPSVQTSFGTDYIYATGDATNLYNRPNQFSQANAATDILFAVRSIVWLKPDHIVIYDRAKSKTANRFKRFFLQFTAAPTVSGKNVTVNTPGGQKVFVSNLLPLNSAITSSVSESLNAMAELENTTHEIKIEDPSNPSDIRFLNVLQGADGNGTKDNPSLIQSNAGTDFEGTTVKNTAVLFQKVWNASFSFTTYSIPNVITRQIVTGMVPNAGFDISIIPNGSNYDVTITPGDDIYADKGGVLIIENANFIVNTLEARSRTHPQNNAADFQITPNPFDECTQICFSLKQDAEVSLEILDLNGKTLHKVLNQLAMNCGDYKIPFSDKNLNPGSYICKLTIGAKQLSQVMILQR